MSVGTVQCPEDHVDFLVPAATPHRDRFVNGKSVAEEAVAYSGIFPRPHTPFWRGRFTFLGPSAQGRTGDTCLVRIIAHEGLHGALLSLPYDLFFAHETDLRWRDRYRSLFWGMSPSQSAQAAAARNFPNSRFPEYGIPLGADENYVKNAVDQCIGNNCDF